ncbi:MAG TPA: hypothetical protein VIC85_15890 [Ktedonobacterales bacterium]
MYLVRHLISTAFRAFFRMLGIGLACALLGAVMTLIVSYAFTAQWPPSALTDTAAIVIATLVGYATALTVLVREAVQGVRDVEKELGKVSQVAVAEVASRVADIVPARR